jgi:hypothetical protein
MDVKGIISELRSEREQIEKEILSLNRSDARTTKEAAQSPLQVDASQLIADFAHTLWLSSAFSCGSPEDALLTAVRLLREKAGGFAKLEDLD